MTCRSSHLYTYCVGSEKRHTCLNYDKSTSWDNDVSVKYKRL